MHKIRRASRRGFTLLEIAIVLVVIGLAATGAISVLRPILDARSSEVTERRMEMVEKAIVLHALRYSCLPCPTDGTLPSSNANAGVSFEGGTPVALGTCATAACLVTDGVVPWRELGISEEDASDGWGNRLRFQIAGSSVVASTCAVPTASLQLSNGMTRTTGTSSCYPVGNLTVDDLNNVAASEPDFQQAAYVLVSSGPDRAMALQATTGTATPDRFGQSGGGGGQDENRDNDVAFAMGYFNANDNTAHFDDIARFRSGSMIVQLCGAGACGNPN
ncbi:MAG: type II secretion system GspH family protein [Rhodospirillaceae bacterium]|nr:type II secretion system GspH family protein [Rhodospirillaceae bacterium]